MERFQVIPTLSKSDVEASIGIRVLRRIADIPTTPFYEGQITKELFVIFEELFGNNEKVEWYLDLYGNIHLHYKGHYRFNKPQLVYVVHLDHPGFHLSKVDGKIIAEMAGGLNREAIIGSQVKMCNTKTGETAHGTIIRKIGFLDKTGHQYVVEPLDPVNLSKEFHFATLSLGEIEIDTKNDIIRSTVLDDYASIAMCIETLAEIAKKKIGINVGVIFHRAEEVGFIGAYTVASSDLIPKSCLTYSVETSSKFVLTKEVENSEVLKEIAKMSKGIIIRTGDKMTPAYNIDAIFLAHMTAVSTGIIAQETRMYGGSCEASLYYAMGYRVAGLCLPLKSYHNGLLEEETAREEISLKDFFSGTYFMTAMAEVFRDSSMLFRKLFRKEDNPRQKKIILKVKQWFEDYHKKGLI